MLKTSGIRKAAFAAALLLLTLHIAACRKEEPQYGRKLESSDIGGHVLSGSANSPVRIEVFSDLQCPACRELFLKVIQPVMVEYKDKVCVVYYEFPLSVHQYARQAARYVEAAYELGQQKALSAYETIFTDQSYWASDGNLEYSVAKALSGDDFQKVRQIVRDTGHLAEIDETIERNLRHGRSKGVSATPTVFISHGGKEEKVDVMLTYPVMKQFLDPITK